MAIISTVRKFLPYVKESSGYALYRLSADGVQMSNGQTLQQKIDYIEESRALQYISDIRFGPWTLNAYAYYYVDMTNTLISTISKRISGITSSNYGSHIMAITPFTVTNDALVPYLYSSSSTGHMYIYGYNAKNASISGAYITVRIFYW